MGSEARSHHPAFYRQGTKRKTETGNRDHSRLDAADCARSRTRSPSKQESRHCKMSYLREKGDAGGRPARPEGICVILKQLPTAALVFPAASRPSVILFLQAPAPSSNLMRAQRGRIVRSNPRTQKSTQIQKPGKSATTRQNGGPRDDMKQVDPGQDIRAQSRAKNRRTSVPGGTLEKVSPGIRRRFFDQ